MPGKVLNFTTRQEFKEYLKKNPNFIVKFTATWCRPCRESTPLVMEFFEQCKRYLDLVIVDADSGTNLCSYLKVRSFPTLLSYIARQPAESNIGANEDDIRAFFVATMKRLSQNVVVTN